TPYRYKAVLHDLRSVFSDMKENRNVFFCLDLTMESEFQFRGNVEELIRIVESLPKGNPVVVVSGRSARTFTKGLTSGSKPGPKRKLDQKHKPERKSKSDSKKFRGK
ncbi:hypothetical protein CH375_09045, partial [Leptospira ellisii]